MEKEEFHTKLQPKKKKKEYNKKLISSWQAV